MEVQRPSSSSTMVVAKSVMEKISEAFENFEAKAFSMLSLSEQWRNLQSEFEFASLEASMARSEKEEVGEEREVGGIVRRAVSLGKEVELRKQRVEIEERMMSERVKDEVDEVIELKDYWQVTENQRFELRKFEEELNVREERIKERFEEVEVKETKVNEVFLECQRVLEVKKEELVAKRRGLVLQEKKLIEQSKMLELKAEHMIEDRKMLVLKEKELNEVLREVELLKKDVDGRCRMIELKEKELSDGVCELELNKKEVDDRFRGVELKEEEVREWSKKVDLMKEEVGRRGEELNEGACQLELRRKEVDDRFREVELKEEEMRVCSKEVRLMKEEVKRKEKEVTERFRELGLQEKQIMGCRKGLELIEKEVDERFRVLESKEKEMSEGVEGNRKNVCHSGLKLIMKEINERFEAVELREKEMIEGFRALELKKKEMNERCKRLELKEKEVGECLEAVKLREKQVSDGAEALEVKVKEIEDCRKGVELKQREEAELIEKWFNEALEVVGSKAKELENCCKVLDEKEMELSSCRKLLESREQSIDERCQSLELKEKQINEQSQSLDLKKKKLNEGFQALELQKKKIDKQNSVVILKKKEIDDRCKVVEVKEKQIRRRRRVLDWREQQVNKCCNAPQFEDKQTKGESFPAITAVVSPTISFFNDIQSLCSNMNAKGLRSYILQHVKEYDALNDNMLDSLWLASDPAKLVLDVIRSLCELEFEEVSMKNLVGGCILLLVQLMKLSVDISSHVKDEAREFSDSWRSLLKQISSPMENFGYLQYLASFKITETHNADELLSLFITLCDEPEVYQPQQIPFLCDALGMRGEITELIRSLILGDKQLQAVRYICTLNMEYDFPLFPLLETHLENIHNRIEEILKIGSRNATAQDDAVVVEVTALKEVLQCISNFKLESIYSPVSLELRIKRLEKEREERKKAAAHLSSIKRCSNSEKERVEEMPNSSKPLVLYSDNQSGRKRPANSEGSPNEAKYPRMYTHHKLMPYNPSRPPVHVWPYQFPVSSMHQTSPPVSWHSCHLGWHSRRYDVPYNTRTGAFGVFGHL